MPSHLAAWFQSIDSATLANINTIVDDILSRPQPDRFMVPAEYNYIHWAAALGPGLTRAVIVTPSLLTKRMNYEIVPHVRGATVFATTKIQISRPVAPLALAPTEDLILQGAEDASGATAIYGLVCLGPATLPPPPSGDVRIIRATATTTLTANVWTTITVTPEMSLEPGTYTLIGFIPISANIIAARAIIPGQVWRPGMPGLAGSVAVASDFDPAIYPQTLFHDMGTFTHVTFPQFQFLATAADTSETVIIYAVKTG